MCFQRQQTCLTFDAAVPGAQLSPTLCNNVLVGICPLPSLAFIALTNDSEPKEAAAMVNTALTVS